MDAAALWRGVVDELAAEGVRAMVVPVERIADARRRVDEAIAGAGFPESVARELADDLSSPMPEGDWRSVVIAAVARPLTQADLTWQGEKHSITVPPHYAGYEAVPRAIARRVDELLRPTGYAAAHCGPPLKTLAACAGLARYGRNNIAYVDGLGSWLQLAACVSDAPPPDDTPWGEPGLLARCERCSACLRACPTGAIQADRFLLHTERCLTLVNEDRAPFPEWVDPAWHTCAVGCLRCQQVCPENAGIELIVDPPELFDDKESAAILAATDRAELSAATLDKLERCGLDYSPDLIARNLTALLRG